MMDRWQRVESLCHAALARPASERAAFLAEACGDDAALRAEVQSLLAGAESAPSFLEQPIAGVATPGSLVGRYLGAYRIDAPIGAGGMGEVYRAHDTRLERDVAVKILPAAWAADPQRRTRFEREARAVAALNHPNICTIHDVGHAEGVDFLVMELVDGESLAARLAKGPLPLEEALARGIEIADALDRAHRQGIVHRDLKPGNVMLARTGSGKAHAPQAKLLDFGLARIVASGVAAGPTTDVTPRTETGAVLGTLQYMAPEQIEGRPADARTDIFAFGALLYEMLTGRRAFEGASTAAVMAAILREEPPPIHPRELGRIVRRCLAKDPLRRYQSARDLLNDLEEVQESRESKQLERGDAIRAEPKRRNRGNTLAWSAVTLIVAAAAFAMYAGRDRSSGSVSVRQRFQLQPPADLAVLPTSPVSTLALSPDGQWIAFRGSNRVTNETALYLRFTGALEPRKIALDGTTPFFSSDSRWLGFFAGNAMYKVPVDGGSEPRRVCDLPNTTSVRGASWGDDDGIVFSVDRALWRVTSAGADLRELTQPSVGIRHNWPDVLPGSAAAVFTLNRGYSDRWRQLAVLSLKTGEVTTIHALSGTAPRYVPSGHLVYSQFGTLYAVPFDLALLRVTGQPLRVQDDVQTFTGSGSVAFDVSSSGSLAYIPQADPYPAAELVWLDERGRAEIIGERRPYIGGAVDLDGKRLVAAVADEFAEADLYMYEMDRRAWGRLTTGLHAWSELAWSPDGKWIFFTSFKSGDAELFRVSAAGGTPEQLTDDIAYWEHPGSVSPDGRTLLFWRTSTSQGNLMTLQLEPRGTPKPLADSRAFESSPRISPNGRWVAYESNESGPFEVHVRPFPGPGGGTRISPHGGNNAQWSHDGRHLYYQRGPEVWTVQIVPGSTFRFREPRMVFKADSSDRYNDALVFGGISDRFLAIRREVPQRQLVYVPHWVEELKRAVHR